MRKKTKKTPTQKTGISLSFRVDKALLEAMRAEAVKNCRSLAGEATHRLRQSLAVTSTE